MTIPAFQKKILAWYKDNRREPRTSVNTVRGKMPWRGTRDPYKILVSEVMLQQTQVSRVLDKYREFLEAFPTPNDLASADDAKLLSVWKGLGYWRRARHLKETASAIVAEHGGRFPREPAELEKLPGIGPYTARALACFAFQHPEAFIDTNIRRVYLHFFFADKEGISDAEILPIAQNAVWKENPREWHYALFDYGAVVLRDKSINKKSRHYAKQSRFEGSFRSFRTAVVNDLLSRPRNRAAKQEVSSLLDRELKRHGNPYKRRDILSSLKNDGLLKETARSYTL